VGIPERRDVLKRVATEGIRVEEAAEPCVERRSKE
jgi:hypothetical protein